MTDDRFDTALRTLVADLVATAPPAPTWESIATRLDPGTGGAVTAPTQVGEPTVDGLPGYPTGPTDRPSWWRRILAGLGALGLVAGGSYAVSWMMSDDDGAASPEEAATAFVEALAAEDAIGVLETLPPSERVVVREGVEDLAAEADRLGLTSGLDLGDVDGVELELDGLTVTAEPLAPDVVAVYVDGTLTSRSTGEQLPLGPAVLEALDPGALADFDAGVASLEGEFADDRVFLVTVREDDRWHVSAWYTGAEYLRRGQERPDPVFGVSPVVPTGAASPEAAAAALVEHLGENDLRSALALALPGESRVLYDYVPLWFPDADRARADYPVDMTVERLDTTVVGDGDERRVRVEGYEYTLVYPEGTVRLRFDGECYRQEPATPSDPFEPYEQCRADALAEGASAAGWEASTSMDVVVVERDGRWYVSPVRSVVQSILGGTAAVPDPATATAMLESGEAWGIFPGRLYGFLGGFGWGVWGRTVVTGSEETVVDEVGTPIDPVTGQPLVEGAPPAIVDSVPTTMVPDTVVEGGPATVVETAPAPVVESAPSTTLDGPTTVGEAGPTSTLAGPTTVPASQE